MRPAEAIARCARLRIQPSASSGHASCSRMVLKRTNWPIVRSPLITSRPPKKTTAAIEIVGRKNSAGQVLRLDAGLADHDVAHGLRLVAEPPAHVVLATERLHHLDAHHRLVRGLGDVALARLHLPRDRHHQVGEPPGDERDQRRCHAGVQGQARVDRRQHDGAADDHHRALHALHDAPADEVADREQVVGRPRHDLAGRVPVEERARKPQVAREQHLAQLGLDPHADPGGRVAAGEVDPEADHRQHHDRDHVRPDVARVARARSRCRSPAGSASGSPATGRRRRTRRTAPAGPGVRCPHQRGVSRRAVGQGG